MNQLVDAVLLAEVALEVAECLPDREYTKPRAEWRWHMVELAIDCINQNQITNATEDLDEVVNNWLVNRGF